MFERTDHLADSPRTPPKKEILRITLLCLPPKKVIPKKILTITCKNQFITFEENIFHTFPKKFLTFDRKNKFPNENSFL